MDIKTFFNSSFAFVSNPMVLQFNDVSAPEESVFPQIVIDVYADLGGPSRMQTYTKTIDSTSRIILDISSTVRGIAAQYSYNTDAARNGGSVAYPSINVSVHARRTYFNKDGEFFTDSMVYKNISAYFGGLSDYERWIAGENSYPQANSVSFTTKPFGEVFMKDQLCSISSYVNGQVKTQFFTNTEDAVDSRDRKLFLFVNSRGVLETVSVLTRESMSYDIKSNRFEFSQLPSYRNNPSLTVYKQGGGAVWQMSSGYVNKEWADWFASEFLMARKYWILHKDSWLPVVVEPDNDTVIVVDRNDPSLMSVSFTVRSAVSGSVR